MKLKRTFVSYLMYLSIIFVSARQISSGDGILLGINVLLIIALTAGLMWIIVHPYLLIVDDDQVHVYKDFFRYRKFNKQDVASIKTSGVSFHNARLTFHDNQKPLKLSLWDISEKSFKKLGEALGVPVM